VAAKYYIGTSGWVYPHWRGAFYPHDLPQTKWLGFYAQHFDTVELNNTFYHLPKEKTFDNWHTKAPESFRYAVKASRFITHIKKLNDVGEPLQSFLDRACRLKEKLGPILYQLPPSMHRNDERLEGFLSLLPQGINHTIEFRHESWLDDKVFDILRRYKTGLCVFDMPGFQCPLIATASFAYIRFHGSSGLYSSCYSDDEMESWAGRIIDVAKKLDVVYIYFNNDAEGFAIRNAQTLRDKLANR
jgi:uncharacterized protein YecE (DUF72 family)